MKRFYIEYLTYNGKTATVEIEAYNEQVAKNQLINCKEVYICKEIDFEVEENKG